MQTVSYPTIRAALLQAKLDINKHIINTLVITDYDLNQQARLINDKIIAVARDLEDLDKVIFRSSAFSFREMELSNTLKNGLLNIDKDGCLQFTNSFLVNTNVRRGTTFVVGKNGGDEADKGLYFVESPAGKLRSNTASMDIRFLVDKYKLPCPTKAIWSVLNIPETKLKGFRIEFKNVFN